MLALASVSAVAQQTASEHALIAGTVTGIVTCDDTHHAARLAKVVLMPISPTTAGNGETFTSTGVDGVFLAKGVAPGDYYVQAYAHGYLSQRDVEQSEEDEGMKAADILALVPVVHVTANAMSTIDLALSRGGAVSGRVEWEDGTPASGVYVNVIRAEQAKPLPESLTGMSSLGGLMMSETDDRGVFRVTGLPAGDYVVEAPVVMGGDWNNATKTDKSTGALVIYAPGVFQRSDAEKVSVKLGEEKSDVRMALNLSALHTVSGRVMTASGQPVTHGSVTLGGNIEGGPTAPLENGGAFTIRFVPPGEYMVQLVSNVPDSRQGAVSTDQQKITVGDEDVSGILLKTP